mmetsp:Transcript_67044/g.189564  ORF Transcript_67044/g.189564 Transcript_67044/m.189564 type:complete len:210 (-) Transcript_67044:281-910(-)
MEAGELRLSHEVCLVDDDGVGGLELADQQHRERLLRLIRRLLGGVVGVQEGRRIHDAHDACEEDALHDRFASSLHCLQLSGDGFGLRNPGALDHEAIPLPVEFRDPGALHQLLEACEEVVAAGAASATVLQPNDAVGIFELQDLRVNVRFRNIVNHDADFHVLAVPQDVPHKRGFASTEETGQDRHWHLRRGFLGAHAAATASKTPTAA